MSTDAGSLSTTASAHYGVSLIDAALSETLRLTPDANLDALLELRRALQHFGNRDPEQLLRDFTRLRKTDEFRFYLTFYRVRRWLEFQLVLLVEDRENRIPPIQLPVQLVFRNIDSLLIAARQQAFEQTEDPIQFEDLVARVAYVDSLASGNTASSPAAEPAE